MKLLLSVSSHESYASSGIFQRQVQHEQKEVLLFDTCHCAVECLPAPTREKEEGLQRDEARTDSLGGMQRHCSSSLRSG